MSDRIEKQIFINAPRSRVWRALSDRTEFGTWFRVAFPPGQFVAGETVTGQLRYPGYEHLMMEIEVVEIVSEDRLSYRWHPHAVDADVDYSTEPRTLVTFTLEDAEGGTLLRLVESGFDALPLPRRAEAFRLNDAGWTEEMSNIERHVTKSR
jgi:uncharacterized protein YndB with AHSA1/START domain